MKKILCLLVAAIAIGSLVVNVAQADGGVTDVVVYGTVKSGGVGINNVMVVLVSEDDSITCTDVTDSSGMYELDPVPPGEYTLQAFRQGYIPYNNSITISGTSSTFMQDITMNPVP